MIENVNQTACKAKEPISIEVANYATRLAERALDKIKDSLPRTEL